MAETTPIGVKPYYVATSERIYELSKAINNYSTTADTDKMRRWAEEIILQCDMVKKLRSTS